MTFSTVGQVVAKDGLAWNGEGCVECRGGSIARSESLESGCCWIDSFGSLTKYEVLNFIPNAQVQAAHHIVASSGFRAGKRFCGHKGSSSGLQQYTACGCTKTRLLRCLMSQVLLLAPAFLILRLGRVVVPSGASPYPPIGMEADRGSLWENGI